MLQVIKMSYEEKKAMLMECDKESLVAMLLECQSSVSENKPNNWVQDEMDKFIEWSINEIKKEYPSAKCEYMRVDDSHWLVVDKLVFNDYDFTNIFWQIEYEHSRRFSETVVDFAIVPNDFTMI